MIIRDLEYADPLLLFYSARLLGLDYKKIMNPKPT